MAAWNTGADAEQSVMRVFTGGALALDELRARGKHPAHVEAALFS
jgi:hypothetical protein